jgi:hypothetical protein
LLINDNDIGTCNLVILIQKSLFYYSIVNVDNPKSLIPNPQK